MSEELPDQPLTLKPWSRANGKAALLTELWEANPLASTAEIGELFTKRTGLKACETQVRRVRAAIQGAGLTYDGYVKAVNRAMRAGFYPAEVVKLMKRVYDRAMSGDMNAAKLFLDRCLGKQTVQIHKTVQENKTTTLDLTNLSTSELQTLLNLTVKAQPATLDGEITSSGINTKDDSESTRH